MKTKLKTSTVTRKSRISSKPAISATKIKQKPGLKTILVPTDFSPESRKAVRYAAALARALGGQIMLLHVIEPTPYGGSFDEIPLLFTSDEMKKAAAGNLKRLCKEEEIPDGLVKRAHIRTGPAYPEILEEAKAIRADMIVIATHGYNALTRVIFGSTTERVVRHAKCPVLVVRENEHDFIKT